MIPFVLPHRSAFAPPAIIRSWVLGLLAFVTAIAIRESMTCLASDATTGNPLLDLAAGDYTLTLVGGTAGIVSDDAILPSTLPA